MSQMSQGSIPPPGSGADPGSRDPEELEGLVVEDASSPLFPALAEAHRSAGRLDEARRVVESGLQGAPENTAGRLVLALTLLDMGQVEGARRQLAQGLSSLGVVPVGPDSGSQRDDEASAISSESPNAPEDLDDSEIDSAFESAEAQPDEMLDANQVVEHALRREDLDEPEGGLSVPSTFATRSMAELLESQGDMRGADVIRSSLEGPSGQHEVDAAEVPAEGADDIIGTAETGCRSPAERVRILATLESWLQNIRRGIA